MNKKLASMLVVGALTCGFFAVGTPTDVQARKVNPDTDATMTLNRKDGKSVVMTMSQIGTIFQNRFPNAALHSVELNTENLKYVYKVTGYSVNNTMHMNIDIITGKTSNEKMGGKPKNIPQRIFNKDSVISPAEAQQKAVDALGEDAVSKGWKIVAEKGEVTYTVLVYQGGYSQNVLINAKDGSFVSKTKPKVLPPVVD